MYVNWIFPLIHFFHALYNVDDDDGNDYARAAVA
jgi:hypothetical protein